MSLAWGTLELFWPAVAAMVALSASRVSRASDRPSLLSRFSLPLIVASGIACALAGFIGDPGFLVRDAVATIVFGAFAPAVSAACLSLSQSKIMSVVAPSVGFLILVVASNVVLLVHCTSGDCL